MQRQRIKTVLLIGGARSGKSAEALKMAEASGTRNLFFIATAEAKDHEMKERIKAHQRQRPPYWRTIEEPLDIAGALEMAFMEGPSVVVVDCLTLWVFNLMDRMGPSGAEEFIQRTAQRTTELKDDREGLCIFVTNEVGMGIVPEGALTRTFRDLAGRTNQVFAGISDEVYLVVAGIGLRIK